MANQQGNFVWNELMSKDVGASQEFYGRLFGWEIKRVEMGPMPYHFVYAGGKQVGGLMEITAEMGEVPTHWMFYVGVDEVDQRVTRATELGGKMIVPGQDIPDIGRFAVIQDPAGAHISPFKGASDDTAADKCEDPPTPGTFCWYELLTNDPEGAKSFYPEIFGWTVASEPSATGEPYFMFKSGEKTVAGIHPMPAEVQHPPYWLTYVAVEDVDAKAKLVEELGGKVLHPPTDIPKMGRFAVIEDNLGGHIALFTFEKQ